MKRSLVLVLLFGVSSCGETVDPSNPCDPDPCDQGGTCTAIESTFECDCSGTGYAGPTCSVDIDECDDGVGPCVNATSCRNLPSTYACICETGWTDDNCDVAAGGDACSLIPCVNASTCTDTENGGYECTCNEGWEGKNCDIGSGGTVCDGGLGPCVNASTCEDTSRGGYECTCDPGWTGANCDMSEQDTACSLGPCANQGVCLDTPDGSYECTCAEGWQGTNCEVSVSGDACSLNPCVNATGCENTPGGGFECSCEAGWEGKNCDQETDECDGGLGPCVHAWACFDRTLDYECQCNGGWEGKNCDVDIDECDGGLGPCQFASSCRGDNPPGSYSCACIEGWGGIDCDQVVAGDGDSCIGSADQAVYDGLDEEVTSGEVVVLAASEDCLLSCFGEANSLYFAIESGADPAVIEEERAQLTNCIATCVHETAPLSGGCLYCYGAQISCAVPCQFDCSFGGSCDCTEELSACAAEFATCSGLTPPDSVCDGGLGPCVNASSCTDNALGGYTCTCLPGWDGQNCDVSTLADCDGTPSSCIRCPAENLPPVIAALFPDGLAVPVDYTADPGTFTAGEVSTVTLSALATIGILPLEIAATVNDGASIYEVVSGGTGAAEIVIPEQEVEGTDLVVDAGEGDIEIDADLGASAVDIELTLMLIDLTITEPVFLDLPIEAGLPGGDEACFIEGDGITLVPESR